MSASAEASRVPATGARHRGRFAPSPTGPLHFGSLVAALASYVDAWVAGGEWLLRIEDIDGPRRLQGAEARILYDLERYGFEWDGPVSRQSERTSLYEAALEQLKSAGLVFPCGCTRLQLRNARVGIGGERVYPGTCRNGRPPSRGGRHQHAWRVRVGEAQVECVDRLQCVQRQELARDVGDFVVKRADGLFAYQLAVVVDDAEQGITDVVRGADLLSSTPRQVLLQKLLGLPTPSYLHVPVAINAAGEKLSKQTRAAALPDSPLPTLLAAWRFLGQDPPADPPADVGEFWGWAHASWKVSRLPPLPMLPAAATLGEIAAGAGI